MPIFIDGDVLRAYWRVWQSSSDRLCKKLNEKQRELLSTAERLHPKQCDLTRWHTNCSSQNRIVLLMHEAEPRIATETLFYNRGSRTLQASSVLDKCLSLPDSQFITYITIKSDTMRWCPWTMTLEVLL